jgi:hypothetical protein
LKEIAVRLTKIVTLDYFEEETQLSNKELVNLLPLKIQAVTPQPDVNSEQPVQTTPVPDLEHSRLAPTSTSPTKNYIQLLTPTTISSTLYAKIFGQCPLESPLTMAKPQSTSAPGAQTNNSMYTGVGATTSLVTTQLP